MQTKEYEVIITNDDGSIEAATVTVQSELTGAKKALFYPTDDKDGVPYPITLDPKHNCYQQDDEFLINEIRQKILVPPSTEGILKKENSTFLISWTNR